jgi:hypothetical protein
MKAKTIRKILRAKVKDWAESVDNPIVAELIRKNTIITGGSIASMLLKEPVNDYDIYFKSKKTALVVAKYYVRQYIKAMKPKIVPRVVVCDDRINIAVKSAGMASEGTDDATYKYFETQPEDSLGSTEYVDPVELEDSPITDDDKGEKYRPVFMSSNAITLSNKVQVIIRFFGSPDEIHENYDFAHCTSWWSSWDEHLELRPAAMEALLARELRYQGSKYPLCSIIRTRKFIKRGFSINAGQYLKMCLQLNELDLNDFATLEDQLTGVDVAYFHQVLEYLRDKNKDFDTAYICEIIDRIF